MSVSGERCLLGLFSQAHLSLGQSVFFEAMRRGKDCWLRLAKSAADSGAAAAASALLACSQLPCPLV